MAVDKVVGVVDKAVGVVGKVVDKVVGAVDKELLHIVLGSLGVVHKEL